MEEKSKSPLESKRLFAVIFIGMAIFLAFYVVDRFGDTWNIFRPAGVGPVDSDHVHGRFIMSINNEWINTNTKTYPELAWGNFYIFLDEENYLHRVATGANLALFLDGIGIEFSDECLIINRDMFYLNGTKLEQKEYCKDGQTMPKMYTKGGHLLEDPNNHIIRSGSSIFLAYDDDDSNPRTYMTNIEQIDGSYNLDHDPSNAPHK